MINLAIIGGGPAGYTAAERAAHKGLSVVLFEKKTLGGTCLNEGCIPTKTLLYSAKMYAQVQGGNKYGILADNVTFDYAKIYARKNKVVRKLVAGIKAKLNVENCKVVTGEAKVISFSSEKVVLECNGELFEAEKLLLCMGSENRQLPIPGIESESVWNSTDALNASVLPASIAIIGGGVIGMEFASLLHSLGVKVTVLEALPEILGNMDTEISAFLRAELAKQGVTFYLQAKVIEIRNSEVVFECNNEQHCLLAEKILVNVGRKPNLDACACIPLEHNKHIIVNSTMRTSQPNVFAAGDITGVSMLAHTAVREAEVAVNTICGIADNMDYKAIPSIVYTNPEIASVGASEKLLAQQQIAYKVHKLPMTYSGRFVAENEGGNGLCKILCEVQTGKIVGVHLAGNMASEIINTAVLAMESGLTLQQWRKSVFGHPTVSEILRETMFAD